MVKLFDFKAVKTINLRLNKIGYFTLFLRIFVPSYFLSGRLYNGKGLEYLLIKTFEV